MYDKALELDSFTWVRAKHAFNDTIRKAVNGHEPTNVVLLDGRAALEAAAPHATPGNESFADGCHLRPSGMYVLARAFFEQMCPKMPDWVRQHEARDTPIPELADILALLGQREHLHEGTLKHLIEKSREHGMDSAETLQEELDYIRAHPVTVDYVRQFALLREIVKTGTEDIQLAFKFIQCLGSVPQIADEEVYELLHNLAQRYVFERSFQYMYAENLRFRDKYPELEVLYRNLLKYFPQDERAYLGLVPLLLRRDAAEEARQLLSQARRHQIPEGACQCMLGDILRQKGDVAAITAYMRSLQEDTNNYSFVLDGLKETLKRFPEATAAQADALRELVSTLYREYKDWKLAGVLEALPGDLPTVELYLKIADQSPAPDLYSMLQQVAVLLDTWNRETRGTVFWQEQTRTHPESALRWVCLAGAFEREGAIKEAEQAYRRVLEQAPNYTPALFKLGMLELDSGNSEHGTDLLIRATKTDTAMAVFVADECSTRAEAFVDQEKMDRASDLYRVALQISPTDFWPQVYLGEIFENQGKNEAAREAYKKVLLQKPESPVSAEKLQDLLVKMNTPPEAILAEWQALSGAHPEAAVPNYYLGMALECLGQLDDARDAYRRALNHNPEVEQAAYQLAMLEVRTGNMDEGLAAMRDIAQKHPNQVSDISKHLGEIAAIFTGQEKMEEAILLYKTALELSPTDLWPQVRLGEIYEAQGNVDAALDTYRQVLLQKPESPVTASKLQRLLIRTQASQEAVLAAWQDIVDGTPQVAAVPLFYLSLALEAAGDSDTARAIMEHAEAIQSDIAAVIANTKN